MAINGFGRIGRAAFKIVLDTPELDMVAVNDLIPLDNLAYLLRYDSVYGRYEREVAREGDALVVGGTRYRTTSEKDPARLPWGELGIDIVFECTGRFTDKEGLQKHLQAGAKRVILSAPSKDEDIGTVVYGVNRAGKDWNLISCASCTTNCITPVVEIMGRRIGIRKAVMTTVHAYTASQALVDGPSKKFRRGRAAAVNLVPTSTGAAKATIKALPQYKGKFDGIAVRAPVPAGSVADITFVTERTTSVEELNALFREEAQSERYRGILGVTEESLVSSDIVKDPHASLIDLEMTQVVDGDLVKVMAWYDNEWGYSTQMVREAVSIAKA
ncbi:MAG: type I glyceraldehyde-3-phosphate dehydrogenase, partial [Thermodesulfovibrionales bacterium]